MPSIRVRAVTAWRVITKAMFTTANPEFPNAKERLRSALSLMSDLCAHWTRKAQEILYNLASAFVHPSDTTGTALMKQELYWIVHFCAELTKGIVDMANHITRFKSESLPFRTASGSPSPFRHSIVTPGPGEEELSLLPRESWTESLSAWFVAFSEWNRHPDLSQCEQPVQETTQNLILLASHVLPHMAFRRGSDRAAQRHIFTGILFATDPARVGFSVANAALIALSKWTQSPERWENDMLSVLYRDFRLDDLFKIAVYHVRRLVVDSDDSELDRELRLWSRNLLILCCSFARDAQLRHCLIKKDTMWSLWNYSCALFSPQGGDLYCRGEEPIHFQLPVSMEKLCHPSKVMEFQHDIHLRKAYRTDFEPNPAYSQWCLLLRVIGDLTPSATSSAEGQQMSLFERTASVLFQSFPQYFQDLFGTYRQPLTLARVERMEASLRFLLTTHEAFSVSAALLSHYHHRRNDILTFLCESSSILHRTDGRFVCPPISPAEKDLAKKRMTFDTDMGLFRICKIGAHRPFFPDENQSPFGEPLPANAALIVANPRPAVPNFPLSYYAWKLAKGWYHCIAMSLEYVRRSTPAAMRREMGSSRMVFKDVMLRLQHDVRDLCSWLANAMLSEEIPEIRMDIPELAESFARIAHVTEEFLGDWGVHRRRGQQDQFHSQIEVMHQLIDDH